MTSNLVRLPGLIDIHVHLRDPGQTEKEDFSSGTRAALAGGVTTVFDMPNNLQPILTEKLLLQKLEIAQKKAFCDFGLYFATDGKNLTEFAKVSQKVAGLKIYLSQTTGNLCLNDPLITEQVFEAWPKGKIIIAHAQEEKIDLAISLSRKYQQRLHLTHLAKRDELEQVIRAKANGFSTTCDVTPHHLFLSIADAHHLKGFGLVKPALQEKSEADFLWAHLSEIDCLVSDHAPHTQAEKQSQNAPYGFPGLETLLPLLLTEVKSGRLPLTEIVRLTSEGPRKIFGLKEENETYVEVDLGEEYGIENKKLLTKSGWSPFAGRKVCGKVKRVYLRGKKVFEGGKILTAAGTGRDIFIQVDSNRHFLLS